MLRLNSVLDNPNQSYIGQGNIIYLSLVGEQTSKTIQELYPKIQDQTKKLRTKNKPVLIVCDLTKIGKTTLSARVTGSKLIRSLDFDRCAVFGKYHSLNGAVNAVVLASGCGFKIRYFIHSKEAKEWLIAKCF